MKRIALYCLLVFHSVIGNSQITFEKSYGGQGSEFGFTATQTKDGGFISVGCTNSFGSGSYDVYVVKTSATGGMMWNKTYGGAEYDYGTAVQKMDDGYIITGFTNSFGNGGFDIYVIKIDLVGNLIWSQTFGGTGDDFSYAIEKGADNSCVITGKLYRSANDYDGFILSLSSNGNTNWFKVYGGSNDELFTSIKRTSDGGFCVSGITTSFGQGYQDAYFVKVDSLGNKEWSRVFGSSNTDYASTALQTSDGNFIITGGTYSFGAGFSDAFLVKLDSSGNSLWQNTFGGQGMDSGNDVVEEPGNGYAIVGHSGSFSSDENVYLVKVSESGNAEYSKSFGGIGTDKGYHIELAKGSGFIISGEMNQKMYLIKTSAFGTTSCSSNALSQRTVSEFIFDSPADTFSAENIQEYYFPTLIGSGGSSIIKCYSNSLLTDLESEIVSTEDTEVEPSENTISERNNYADDTSAGSAFLISDLSFEIYPNPGNGSDLNILVNGNHSGNSSITIYDQLGRKQFENRVDLSDTTQSRQEFILDKKLPAGFYMIHISTERGTRSRTWIVQ